VTAGATEATHNLNGNGILSLAALDKGSPATFITHGNLCLPVFYVQSLRMMLDIAIWRLHAAGVIPTKAEH
jgi:hypothetical protein